MLFLLFVCLFFKSFNAHRFVGKTWSTGCGLFSQNTGDHGDVMIWNWVLPLLQLRSLWCNISWCLNDSWWLQKNSWNFILAEHGSSIFLHYMAFCLHIFLCLKPFVLPYLMQDPVTGLPTWHDRPLSPRLL